MPSLKNQKAVSNLSSSGYRRIRRRVQRTVRNPSPTIFGVIRSVRPHIRLVRTQSAGVNGEIVRLHLLVDYIPTPEEDPTLLKNEEYYSVPPLVRVGYGISYFGLAAFLIFMLAVIGQAPIQPPRGKLLP